jgi:hypothetical protein
VAVSVAEEPVQKTEFPGAVFNVIGAEQETSTVDVAISSTIIDPSSATQSMV